MNAILDAYAEARAHHGPADDDRGADDQGQGRVVRRRQGRLARQGVQEGRGARSRARRARDAVRARAGATSISPRQIREAVVAPGRAADAEADRAARPTQLGEQVATREAYGTALAKLGEADSRVVALDADVKNSTFSDKFEKALPDRFYQNFIAEQVMIGSAMGLAARGAIPFPSTFACFLTRAADFIRMAAISNVGIKMAGSHAGVSIGEDGPSQMALEDLAMCRAQPNIAVLYPCDAVSAERLVALDGLSSGPGLHAHQPAEDAGDLRERRDVRGRRAEGAARERRRRRSPSSAAGVTVFEALKAYDQLKAEGTAIRVIDLYSVAPVDRDGARSRRATRPAAASSPSRITTRPAASATRWPRRSARPAFTVHRLAVREIPRSGKPDELLDRYGISARHIVEAVRAVLVGKAVGASALSTARKSGRRRQPQGTREHEKDRPSVDSCLVSVAAATGARGRDPAVAAPLLHPRLQLPWPASAAPVVRIRTISARNPRARHDESDSIVAQLGGSRANHPLVERFGRCRGLDARPAPAACAVGSTPSSSSACAGSLALFQLFLGCASVRFRRAARPRSQRPHGPPDPRIRRARSAVRPPPLDPRTSSVVGILRRHRRRDVRHGVQRARG